MNPKHIKTPQPLYQIAEIERKKGNIAESGS